MKPATLNHYNLVALSAAIGAVMICAMVAITVTQGIGFQDFESILRHNDIDTYNSQISNGSYALRWIYPIDTIYIFAYLTMVFSMANLAKDRTTLTTLAIIAVVMTAGLDFIENNHIVAMANRAERGYPVSIEQVTVQTVITQVKFNFGLLLTLMISFMIPFTTTAARITRWLAWAIVLGAPVALLSPLTTLIYITMNVGLGVMIAYIYRRQAPDQG